MTPERKVWLKEVRGQLERLELTEAQFFPLPKEQPARRDTAMSIGGMAHRVWGAGGYLMRSIEGGVYVCRRPR